MIQKSDNIREERIALFPGSFDPFTIGHADIVRRACCMFDKVIVAVGYNENKKSEMSAEDRVMKIQDSLSDIENVEVASYSGLTVAFATERGARFIVRGVRDVKDFEYERNIAEVNKLLAGIETILLYSTPGLGCISSSMVRELSHNGVDVSRFIAGLEKK